MEENSDLFRSQTDSIKAFQVFTPHLHYRSNFLYPEHGRFSHYTSAEAALSILNGRALWLRNVMTMNDYSEIEYGIDLVNRYFGSHSPNLSVRKFWALVEIATGGQASSLKQTFDDWLPDIRTQTYVSCLSEHRPEEDQFGRLSMWRGYGQSTGVCLVLNATRVIQPDPPVNVFTYPIFYCNEASAFSIFEQSVENILSEETFIRSLDPDFLHWQLLTMLQSFVFSLKHPGFAEEAEWRLVHRPNAFPSSLLRKNMLAVNGVPQRLYELPLLDENESNIAGLDPRNLVDRVIIGPTNHPRTIWNAFVESLEELGFEDAANRVHCSDIPLRSQ